MPGDPTTYHSVVSIPSRTWTIVTGIAFWSVIIASYLAFVAQGGMAFLPTISRTWEQPPGSIFSRTIGVFSIDMMYIISLFIYWARTNKRAQLSTDRIQFSEGTILVISLIGLFSLTWVTSICDSPNPQCRGNNMLHLAVAIPYFVLYNMYILIVSFEPVPDRGEDPPQFLSRLCNRHFLLAIISAISKVRWIIGLPKDVIFAIFEWTDGAIIIFWVISYVSKHCKTVTYNIVHWPDGLRLAAIDSEESFGPFITLKTLRGFAIGFCLITLLVTFISAFVFGQLPKDHIPFISDLWVYIPGDWLSRWGVAHGVLCSIFSQILLYFSQVTPPANPNALKHWKILTGLAITSFLALSMVGAVNETENKPIHFLAAGVFFSGYDLYILLSLYLIPLPPHQNQNRSYVSTSSLGWILLVIKTLSKARWLPMLASAHTNENTHPDPMESVRAILEWSDTLAMVTYMWLDVYRRPNTNAWCFMVVYGGEQGEDEHGRHQEYTMIMSTLAGDTETSGENETKRAPIANAHA
ncbi:hypothetical protein AAMO2058_000036800 [Amorphochlora amoebiformis]